jgi:hypothetical protein
LCHFREEGEFMGFETLCEKMIGKKVCVTFKDKGAPVIGKCTGYTRAIDNDPEIAEIIVDVGEKGFCYGLMESEISDVKELKD